MLRVWFLCEGCGSAAPVLEKKIETTDDFAISIATFLAFSASDWGLGIFTKGLLCPECKAEEYDRDHLATNFPADHETPPPEEDESWMTEYDPNWYHE